MTLEQFQKQIEDIYFERDQRRGMAETFMWFTEEVGELSRAIRRGDEASKLEEFADCLAWLATLASMSGIRWEDAVKKYAEGCPRCRRTPCDCPEKP